MTYHGPILLLDMRLIILLVGSRACEGDLLILTIVIERIVDEFTASIRGNGYLNLTTPLQYLYPFGQIWMKSL
jgi:hypothetical protein